MTKRSGRSPVRHPLAWIAALALALAAAWPPARFDPSDVPSSVRVTDRAGRLLYEYRPEGIGRPVRLSDVPPAVLAAVVAVEDRRFPWHPGVDAVAIARAALTNVRSGRIVSGASTLAMQVSRMRRGGRGRSWPWKLVDAWTALRLTSWYGRPAVLEEWLARAWFGRGAYGIDAGARAWFGKSPRDLTVAEAAFLAGLPQSPGAYGREPDGEATDRRRAVVLAAMVESGLLSAEDARAAATVALDFVEPEPVPLHAIHLALARARAASARGSVEVRTTLDLALQSSVEALARGHASAYADRGVGQVAAVVLDVATGDVLAWLGSADFTDAARRGANDGVLMRRQPGSALKPFVYAEGFARRAIAPSSILADIETPILEAGAAFSVENYDRRFHGPVPARRALASSYNVPAVRLARTLGVERVLDRLHAFGFASLDRPASDYGLGLVLGNGEVRLVELARAYAALARGGSLPPVTDVLWERLSTSDTVRTLVAPATPTGIGPAEAFLVTDILSDPEARAPGFGRGGPLELPFPAAAKTGTSKDYRDNWAVAYTPRVVVAVWAGNFDGAPMRDVTGVTGAGTLMRSILEWIGPGGPFAEPQGLVRTEVCAQSGARPGAFCPGRVTELFLAGMHPVAACDVHRELAVDRVSGFLADATSRPEDVELRRFTVHPDEFRAWSAANGIALPPPARPVAAPGGGVERHPDFRILLPEDGTVLQMDPVLRPEFQRMPLRAAVPGSLFDLHWLVDGVRLEGPFDGASWRLSPGRHRIEARGIDAQGRVIASSTVSVLVHPVR